jgi:UDP-glucose:(heptosyl)LPS alpha-1,3-glucosyltransferase
MKIALVILHADPMRGGAERYTFDLATALKNRGHDVSLLATTFADVPANIHTISLSSTGFTRTRKYLRALDSLDQHLATNSYDIVHAMFPVRQCDVYHPHAGLAVDAKMDLFNPRRRAMAQVESELLNSANPPRVLCLSEYVKKSVKQVYSLDDAHLPILFNAVNLERFDSTKCATKNDGEIIALMIAQDFARKGLRETILALAKVPENRLVLHVVGKQRIIEYQKLAISNGVQNRVRFLGPSSDIVPNYCAADFFVLPTKHDPCSLVVLESLAMGVPVISTRFNGACEIITDAIHGFVLSDPKDIDAIATSMQRMLDGRMRARMSAACLELRPQLSFEHHLDRLLEIYSTAKKV